MAHMQFMLQVCDFFFRLSFLKKFSTGHRRKWVALSRRSHHPYWQDDRLADNNAMHSAILQIVN
jgi:hypothetical protein